MRTLCIVDNALKDFVGHHFEYARCLYECARTRNEPVVILGHRRLDDKIAEQTKAERVFRRSPYDFPTTLPVVRDLVNPTLQNYLFFMDLRKSLQGRCSREWIVFAPAITHNQIIAWAAWLQTFSPDQCPTVILTVRNSYRDGSNVSYLNKRAYFAWPGFKWLERLAAAGRRIHLASDSQQLVEEFGHFTRLPIAVIPTPHTQRTVGAVYDRPFLAESRGTGGHRPPLQFVWLGGIRTDKGFLPFVDAVLALEPELRAGCFEFVIQSNLDSPYDTEAAAAREKLKRAGLPGVTLIERTLSGEEYSELLQGATALVIPRLLRLFRSQTSGPFVEALAASKPVVVTDKSWMSEQLKHYGGGVTFKDQDSRSLASAIRTIASNPEQYRLRAEQSSAEWASIHNPDRLYDMLHSTDRTMRGL